MYEFLKTINSPYDLRALSEDQLPRLADELRDYVLESVSKTGGHLSSNLGTVELTVALHYAFNTPDDRIVWDVGHQTYPHKILTGRREKMASLRQYNGISGFPKRSESEYDDFGTAHSSTSISAALGMALAAQITGEKRASIAVIGDGAMTAGMAFEALNNAGIHKGLPLLVILNDNEMSISPPVGALSRYLAKLLSGNFYTATKKSFEKMLSFAPDTVAEFAKRFEEHTKGMFVPGTMFEEFGFRYIGPVNGHDLATLVPTLQNMRELILSGDNRPQFLHVVTKKGQGYKLAENDPILYHGPGKFDPVTGIVPPATPAKKTYTQVFGEWLCKMGDHDPKLVAITPAMREGSGLVEFEKRHPKRYFDVGIAEQHAVTFAAGLATEQLKPVVAIYSTFLQRAYDQLIHDVALQDLDVLFAIDRAGLVGADGATHAGAYDLAFLRCIPNMVVMTPSDENEAWQMLNTGHYYAGPAAVRYPRGGGTGATIDTQVQEGLPIGKGVIKHQTNAPQGQRVAIFAFGSMVRVASQLIEKMDVTIVDMRFVKPIDVELILSMAQTHDYFVSIEEGCVMGGAGSAVAEVLGQHKVIVPHLQLGLPDRFIDHGDPSLLLAECGLDVAGIEKSIRNYIQ